MSQFCCEDLLDVTLRKYIKMRANILYNLRPITLINC